MRVRMARIELALAHDNVRHFYGFYKNNHLVWHEYRKMIGDQDIDQTLLGIRDVLIIECDKRPGYGKISDLLTMFYDELRVIGPREYVSTCTLCQSGV